MGWSIPGREADPGGVRQLHGDALEDVHHQLAGGVPLHLGRHQGVRGAGDHSEDPDSRRTGTCA